MYNISKHGVCACKHTAKSDDKTQFRVRLHHLANSYFHLRVQIGSQNQRNPNAPTFGERSIEWILRMKEKTKKAAWSSHKNVHTVQGSYSSPAGASVHMMSKKEFTLAAQETIRKSTDTSVIMTAHGTNHPTEAATVHVCHLEMFVQFPLFQESLAVLSLGNFREGAACSYEWYGHPSYLIMNGKTFDCDTDNHNPEVVPGVQEPTTRPTLWMTGSRHELWATMS